VRRLGAMRAAEPAALPNGRDRIICGDPWICQPQRAAGSHQEIPKVLPACGSTRCDRHLIPLQCLDGRLDRIDLHFGITWLVMIASHSAAHVSPLARANSKPR
jgi:hypothetical protein